MPYEKRLEETLETARESHIRRWAVLMIMHLEDRDQITNMYSYPEALVRLRDLIDLELQQCAYRKGELTG